MVPASVEDDEQLDPLPLPFLSHQPLCPSAIPGLFFDQRPLVILGAFDDIPTRSLVPNYARTNPT